MGSSNESMWNNNIKMDNGDLIAILAWEDIYNGLLENIVYITDNNGHRVTDFEISKCITIS